MPNRRTGLRAGDIIRRPKGPVTHVGIVLDEGLVLHNAPGKGEHLSSLADFSRGRPLTVDRVTESERLRLAASARAVSGGRRYHLLGNNCEHTLHRAREGAPRSPQMLTWTLGVVGAVAGTVLVRHWAGTVAGWELGRRLGAGRGIRH